MALEGSWKVRSLPSIKVRLRRRFFERRGGCLFFSEDDARDYYRAVLSGCAIAGCQQNLTRSNRRTSVWWNMSCTGLANKRRGWSFSSLIASWNIFLSSSVHISPYSVARWAIFRFLGMYTSNVVEWIPPPSDPNLASMHSFCYESKNAVYINVSS